MATLNFPDAPDTGDIYFDSNSGFTYEWNGTVWISRGPSTVESIKELDNISGSFNGSTTTFNLTSSSAAVTPVNAQQLVINIGNVMQKPGDDYTVSGSTITFTTAPLAGYVFQGTLLGSAIPLDTLEDGSVSPSSFDTTDSYNVGGITVTGITTVTDFTISGITTVANLEPADVNISGIGTVSNVIMTKDAAGLGATMGAAVGVVTYYGDGSNLTGLGLTFFPISYDPGISSTNIPTTTNITLDWNHPIKAGSGTITIRSGSASGTILDQFVVGSSSSITFANNQVILDPAVDLSNDTQYFVTYPAGSIKSLGDKYQNDQLIYSFTVKPAPIISIWAMGKNWKGTLGQNQQGPTQYRSSPTQIPGGSAATSWKSIGITGQTMQGTKADGTLWAWGSNDYGNLGQSMAYGGGLNLNQRSSPTQIGTDTDWDKSLSQDNGSNSIAIKTDGTLWVWGTNTRGQLGQNESYNAYRSSPTQVPGTWSTGRMSGSTASGIKTDGTLWTWGTNNYGQLGLNTPINNPSNNGMSSPIQVGTDTTWSKISNNISSGNWMAGVKTDGTLWAWGLNWKGQLGQNEGPGSTAGNLSSPTQIPGTTWNYVSVDTNYGVGTKTDGTMWSWGYNSKGELGLNDTVERSSPTQIPGTTWVSAIAVYDNTIASKTDGTVWVWGTQYHGQLGLNNLTRYSSPIQLPGTWTAADGEVINPFEHEACTGYDSAGVLKSN